VTSTERAPLLSVSDLDVGFPGENGLIHAVRGVDFAIERGEAVALVGESGSGKSVSALALMGLLPGSARVRGSIRLEGKELVGGDARELRRLRGGTVAMVFQEPMTSLNPVLRVGRQIEEALALHRGFDRVRARRETVELLGHVGIASPEQRADQYPHELSGGMKQRVMIAMAIAGRPKLLIADEPTTALDVTIQAQILSLLRSLSKEHDMALLLITHDLGIVAHYAERVHVMYGGKLVEEAPVASVFSTPAHPYTRALLGALPRPALGRARLEAIPGRVPSPDRLPSGCPFAPRCAVAIERCGREMPPLEPVVRAGAGASAEGRAQRAACWVVAAESAAALDDRAGRG
jgi:oligopeptide/dipeptide ABC transporter ATP-binding protein